ncbi:MAG: hypothetical protein AB1556_06555 [Bacillota bacterium]
MKNKFFLLVLGILLIAAIAAPAAFASMGRQMRAGSDLNATAKIVDVSNDGQANNSPSGDEQSFQQFHDQMFNWMEKWARDGEKSGALTPEQARAWQDHFKYMREFHRQMGFNGMMGMMNGGMMNGIMNGGMMGGYGYGKGGGNGMMGGWQ